MGLHGRRRNEAYGFFSRRKSKMSSNGRELTAVLLLTMMAAHHLKGHVVLVKTDNITIKAYINRMGRRSRYLSAAFTLWLCTARRQPTC